MKRLLSGWLAMMLLMAVSSVSYGAQRVSHNQQTKIQKTLDDSQANVMVLVNGQTKNQPLVLQHRTVGADSPQALNPNRLFPVGSTQKILTGWLTLQAVHRHRLRFHSKVSRYYPQIQNGDQITIWQLLTHTSGLNDNGRFADQPLTNEHDQLAYGFDHYQSTGGHGWQYASINYVLLAGILAKVNHQSYAHQLERQIIQPNHLHHTKLYYQVHHSDQVQQSCILSGDAGQDWQHLTTQLSTTLGAGDLLSSPHDYWIIINYLFTQRPHYFHQVLKTPVKSAGNYYAGMYRRDNQLHSNGTVDGYTCVVYNDGQKTMLVFSNTLGAKEIDQLAANVAKIYYQ